MKTYFSSSFLRHIVTNSLQAFFQLRTVSRLQCNLNFVVALQKDRSVNYLLHSLSIKKMHTFS